MKEVNKKQKRGEGITHLSSLFEKYRKTLIAPQSSVVKIFIEVVQSVLELDIPKNSCSYNVSTKTLYIHAPGPIKNEILISKKTLLQNLEERLSSHSCPKDIV